MSRFRIRRFLFAGGLIALPLLLLGVAPALQDLIQQLNTLQGQVQALEGESQIFQQDIIALEAESLLQQQQLASARSELDMQLVVVDSNGVQVGELTSIDGDRRVTVLFDLEGFRPFWVEVRREFLSGSSYYLMFESIDCSGDAFLQPDFRFELFTVLWMNTDPQSRDPIYLADPNATPTLRTVGSQSSGSGNCSLPFEPRPRTSVPVLPAFIIWQDEFTPPFRVVTRREFRAMQAVDN